ncbi:MAG: hypothetical protein IKW90_01895 [Lachnospiraceae bacterium]|nr:hypothetical protein [Lachnospiraceae bacterium]
MNKTDYWLKMKYYLSGLKLLAEISSLNPENREKILEKWFQTPDIKEDDLQNEIKKNVKDSISSCCSLQDIVDGMISFIPKEVWYQQDSCGYTFRPYNPDKLVERIYNEKEHKYKLRAVYEGLILGIDEYGQSFADLRYGFESMGYIKWLEERFHKESINSWMEALSRFENEELAVLSSGASRGGRFQILSGLSEDRVSDIVIKTILLGPNMREDAERIAQRLFGEWGCQNAI